MRALFCLFLAAMAVGLSGCCGPHPIRDRWCDSWSHRRHPEQHAAPHYDCGPPPCCGADAGVMVGP